MEDEQSSTYGKLDAGTRITRIKFAGTALMYESLKAPILQRKSYKPVFVHHVVLIPQNHGTIGTVFTQPFALARSLATDLNTAYCGNSPVSISIAGCLKWDEYDGLVKYRRWYGIAASLNKYLVTQKVIATATHFKLCDENVFTYNASSVVMFMEDNDAAYRIWEDKVVLDMQHICRHFEPIIID